MVYKAPLNNGCGPTSHDDHVLFPLPPTADNNIRLFYIDGVPQDSVLPFPTTDV